MNARIPADGVNVRAFQQWRSIRILAMFVAAMLVALPACSRDETPGERLKVGPGTIYQPLLQPDGWTYFIVTPSDRKYNAGPLKRARPHSSPEPVTLQYPPCGTGTVGVEQLFAVGANLGVILGCSSPVDWWFRAAVFTTAGTFVRDLFSLDVQDVNRIGWDVDSDFGVAQTTDCGSGLLALRKVKGLSCLGSPPRSRRPMLLPGGKDLVYLTTECSQSTRPEFVLCLWADVPIASSSLDQPRRTVLLDGLTGGTVIDVDRSGREVVVSGTRHGEQGIWLVDITSHATRKLTPYTADTVRLSADGDQLLIQRGNKLYLTDI